MKDWLYPGAEVVFVNAERPPNANSVGDPIPLTPRKVYVVREIEPIYLPFFGMVGVRLEGIVPPLVEYRGRPFEPAFFACHFRPLTKRSTDAEVSKLKRLLNTTPADLEREGV